MYSMDEVSSLHSLYESNDHDTIFPSLQARQRNCTQQEEELSNFEKHIAELSPYVEKHANLEKRVVTLETKLKVSNTWLCFALLSLFLSFLVIVRASPAIMALRYEAYHSFQFHFSFPHPVAIFCILVCLFLSLFIASA